MNNHNHGEINMNLSERGNNMNYHEHGKNMNHLKYEYVRKIHEPP